MMNNHAGYTELAHTADCMLRVWAPDLPGLFEQAARGMYSLEKARLQPGIRIQWKLFLQAQDYEGLLVDFLNELLWMTGQEGLGFDEFYISIENHQLMATITGARLIGREKEIKAATFHQLEIRHIGSRWEVEIVFDV
jgi:SHS2 domain-containing protein